jgi:hypothetical protein
MHTQTGAIFDRAGWFYALISTLGVKATALTGSRAAPRRLFAPTLQLRAVGVFAGADDLVKARD